MAAAAPAPDELSKLNQWLILILSNKEKKGKPKEGKELKKGRKKGWIKEIGRNKRGGKEEQEKDKGDDGRRKWGEGGVKKEELIK